MKRYTAMAEHGIKHTAVVLFHLVVPMWRIDAEQMKKENQNGKKANYFYCETDKKHCMCITQDNLHFST